MKGYLEPAEFIDSDHSEVRAFAFDKRGSASDPRTSIVNVYQHRNSI